MKGIIKSKYTDIKLAKGVLVDSQKHSFRDYAQIGVSTEDYGSFWFHLPKGRAIFKTYDGYLSEIKNLRIANELLCYELAKQMGIRCAEYELASLENEKTGVVTYEVNTQNQKLINSVELFRMKNLQQQQDLEKYSELIDKLIVDGYKINKDKVMKDLFKISFFDSLTMQSDRNSANVFFLLDEKNKSIKVAPLIDNEFAFNIQNMQRSLKENADINSVKFNSELDYIYKMITIDNEVRDDSTFKENVKQIVKIAFYSEEYGKVFKNFMKGFDVKKAIKKIKIKGVEISPKYEEYLLMAEQVIKDIYREEVNNLKTNQSTQNNQDLCK